MASLPGTVVAGRARTATVLAWAPWAVVVAGTLLRLARFADNRSFWLDESLLGLNLLERSTRDLLRSLDYVQSAPLGFLLAQKEALDLLGEAEWTLRLLPFVASIAALVLFALVARRLLGPWTTLLAVTIFAVSEPLLYQSSEAKPYSSDVAVALLLVWLALRAFETVAEGLTFRSLVPLGIVGTAAVWFSYPSVFVLAAAFGGLVVCAGRRGLRPLFRVAAPVGLLWVVSFLVLYTASSVTIATIRSSIFTGDAHGPSKLVALARASWASFIDPLGFVASLRGVALLCLAMGVVAVIRRAPASIRILLLAPGLLALVAAYIERYPPGGRFWLFLVPFATLLIARGAAELVSASRESLLVALLVGLLLVGQPVGAALRGVADPPKREHLRPLLQSLVREWRPGDFLFTYVNAQYALRFYGECGGCGVRPYPFALRRAPAGADDGFGFPAALVSGPSVEVGKAHAASAPSLAALDRLAGRPRVWLLFSHVWDVEGLNEERLALAYLDTLGGRRLAERREPGAALYLYDLRP